MNFNSIAPLGPSPADVRTFTKLQTPFSAKIAPLTKQPTKTNYFPERNDSEAETVNESSMSLVEEIQPAAPIPHSIRNTRRNGVDSNMRSCKQLATNKWTMSMTKMLIACAPALIIVLIILATAPDYTKYAIYSFIGIVIIYQSYTYIQWRKAVAKCD